MIIRIVCTRCVAMLLSFFSLIAIGIGYAPYRLRLIVQSKSSSLPRHSVCVCVCLPIQLYFNLTLFNILALLMIYSRISNQFFRWRRFSMCDRNYLVEDACFIQYIQQLNYTPMLGSCFHQMLTNFIRSFF